MEKKWILSLTAGRAMILPLLIPTEAHLSEIGYSMLLVTEKELIETASFIAVVEYLDPGKISLADGDKPAREYAFEQFKVLKHLHALTVYNSYTGDFRPLSRGKSSRCRGAAISSS